MTDWKSRYDTLQRTHEQVVKDKYRLERKVRFLEKLVASLEAEKFRAPSHGIGRNGAQRRAERLFELSGHED